MSGAGTKNRPPIARNPAIGVNGGGVHNIGGVNTERSSSSVVGVTQVQQSTESPQTNISQGGGTVRSRSTSHNTENTKNGGQTVNNCRRSVKFCCKYAEKQHDRRC